VESAYNQGMDHLDHLDLLRKGIPGPGGVWADFGSGTGAFTLALAELIGATGEVYSLDKDRSALRKQEQSVRARFPDLRVHYLAADFTRRLELPILDGAIMANALHFLREKEAAVQLLHNYLRPGGRFILVEYNVEQGNPWVPYPLPYTAWEALAGKAGFAETRLLHTRPSRFLREIYAAVSVRGKQEKGDIHDGP
jgi:SAM-dependent methyltransferase